MLTSLLPGFREVRAPIAAGALLMASAYMLAASWLDRIGERDSQGDGLARLSDLIGGRGWFAVATVTGYLAGSMYVSVVRRYLKGRAFGRLGDTTSVPYAWLTRKQDLGERVMAPFTRLALRRLGLYRSARAGHPYVDPIPTGALEEARKAANREPRQTTLKAAQRYEPELARELGADILRDTRAMQLLVADPNLFGTYDRLAAEAEFRDAITLPGLLAALVVIANVDASGLAKALLVAGALVAAGALFVMARRHDREAWSLYAFAVTWGVVSTPTLDRDELAHKTVEGSAS